MGQTASSGDSGGEASHQELDLGIRPPRGPSSRASSAQDHQKNPSAASQRSRAPPQICPVSLPYLLLCRLRRSFQVASSSHKSIPNLGTLNLVSVGSGPGPAAAAAAVIRRVRAPATVLLRAWLMMASRPATNPTRILKKNKKKPQNQKTKSHHTTKLSSAKHTRSCQCV